MRRTGIGRGVCPQDLGIGSLFERVGDAVVVADAKSQRIVLWNPAAEKMFGYSFFEALEMRVEALVPESLKGWHRAGIARYGETGHGPYIDSHAPLDLPAVRKDGQEIWVELSLSPIEPLDEAADLDSLAPYTATVTSGAKDLAGNGLDQDSGTAGEQAKTWDFRVADTTPPLISGLSPSSGLQRGTITLSASDNSGSVSRVRFQVRGVQVGDDDVAPYSTSFNTASFSDGAATIRATAFDAAGNSSFTESNVTIDNTAPTLTITSGPDGQTFGPGTTQTWNFSAADTTSGLASVQCSIVPTGSAANFSTCFGGSTSQGIRRVIRSLPTRPGASRRALTRALHR